MTRQILGMALACLAACGLCGCGPAAQVNDPAEPQTPTARAINSKPATGPGPQDLDAPMDFTTTESGLKYRVLRKGSGATPTKANYVTVNYKGWLEDPGTPFDQSYGKGPFSFSMDPPEVIQGWIEGVTHVAEGGMIELEIPSQLGYREQGFPPVIPPNATLHFIVELIAVQ